MTELDSIHSFVAGKPVTPEEQLAIAEDVLSIDPDILHLCDFYAVAISAVLRERGEEGNDAAMKKMQMVLLGKASAAYARVQKYQEALILRQRAYELAVSTLGTMHRDTLSSLHGIGKLQLESGSLVEAKKTLERVIDLRRKNPEAAVDLGNSFTLLGRVYEAIADFERAIPCHQEAVRIFSDSLGPESIDTGVSLNDLGCALLEAGKTDEARICFERALKIYNEAGEDIETILENLEKCTEQAAEQQAG